MKKEEKSNRLRDNKNREKEEGDTVRQLYQIGMSDCHLKLKRCVARHHGFRVTPKTNKQKEFGQHVCKRERE